MGAGGGSGYPTLAAKTRTRRPEGAQVGHPAIEKIPFPKRNKIRHVSQVESFQQKSRRAVERFSELAPLRGVGKLASWRTQAMAAVLSPHGAAKPVDDCYGTAPE
jgi:hypothetical protein